MPFTREDARRHAKENIARICAEQGITVAVTDPELIARLASGLRVGKQRADAARIKGRTTNSNRVHKHVGNQDR
jgi:hypothetical protein